MKIGIDISQLAYPGTGVANYLENFIESLTKFDNKNEFVLFFSSLRGDLKPLKLGSNFSVKKTKLPPSLLNIIWNNLHIFPIENFVGEVDWFITSDWTEPPAKKAKKATIIYDMIVYKYPDETDKKITAPIKPKK